MALTAPGLYSRIRPMLPEVGKFCVIGGIGTVIDLGGAAVLHGRYHIGPLGAKAVSVTVATAFTYLGSRFWTFRHRENQPVHREALLFIVLNLAGLFIAEAVIGIETYAVRQHGSLAYNAASVIGTGLGTVFRFYTYRKWVFVTPSASSPASRTAKSSAGPQQAGGQWAGGQQAVPDYPPWELDPAFATAERAAGGAARVPPAYTSPWEPEAGRARHRGPVSPWDAAPAFAQGQAEPRPAGRHRRGG
jgi:putative flippase GtrA